MENEVTTEQGLTLKRSWQCPNCGASNEDWFQMGGRMLKKFFVNCEKCDRDAVIEVKLHDTQKVFSLVQLCHHEHVTATGSRYVLNGEIYDTVKHRCDDCGAIVDP